ncbi:uncharacterized protein LOC134435263 [Engraulis encrasicolus]|uniref:uncharacterized protein LOC134435263 n=1 Tax=Engraulis encrasicolus TaxID=184585 RepID=UPI002FD24011
MAPVLGLPDYDLPFHLFVCEKNGYMSGVLCQLHGGRYRPIAYLSKQLDPVARGMIPCLKAVAAAAAAVISCTNLVLLHPLTVHVPHAVHSLLLQANTQHLTTSRLLSYQHVLLTQSHVTLVRCSELNPATLLPTAEDGEPHSCCEVVAICTKPRPDISETPLLNSDLILYVDGSSMRDECGQQKSGYAVVNPFEVVEAYSLPSGYSAQASELVALIRACILAKNQSVCIYTDSRYGWGVVHDHGAIWRERGFLTAAGKPIQHKQLVEMLLKAIQLPSAIAVVKCAAHSHKTDEISQGNDRADSAAKQAAKGGEEIPPNFLSCPEITQ